MKTAVKHNKAMIISAVVLALFVLYYGFIFNAKLGVSETIMDGEQVAKLKATYSKYTGISELDDGRNAEFSVVAQRFDTFVYGKVSSSKIVGGQIIGLDGEDKEFFKKIGADGTIKFNCYIITVEKDSENIFKKGDKIVIGLANTVDNAYPILERNSKIILPVGKSNNIYTYTIEGMYYVTEDSHIIAYYVDEDKDTTHPANCKSGVTVDEFLKNVKQLKS